MFVLLILGLAAGAIGTIVGLGGAFIIMPALLLIYPNEKADLLTGLSLVAVFFNALSGSTAYARMKRIDFRAGAMFAAATVPGAMLGALSTSYFPRSLFDPIFGSLLLVVAATLLVRPAGAPSRSGPAVPGRFSMQRRITDSQGTVHEYSFKWPGGVALSLAAGYISSLFGIGGGIIHVPALIRLFGFPVHIATATSHFILAFMALAGTVIHLMDGSLKSSGTVIMLAIGAIIGAPFGAKLSSRLHGRWIMRSLAAALALVALRILTLALWR